MRRAVNRQRSSNPWQAVILQQHCTAVIVDGDQVIQLCYIKLRISARSEVVIECWKRLPCEESWLPVSFWAQVNMQYSVERGCIIFIIIVIVLSLNLLIILHNIGAMCQKIVVICLYAIVI